MAPQPKVPVIIVPTAGPGRLSEIKGTADPRSEIRIIIDWQSEHLTTANDSGEWSFDPSGLPDGLHYIIATADTAGVENPFSKSVGFYLSSLIVGHPDVVSSSADASFVFASGEDETTFHVAVDGQGVSTPGPTLKVEGLDEGDHTIVVTATDASGKAASNEFRWTVDAVDQAPTHIGTKLLSSLEENTTARTRLGQIYVQDPDLRDENRVNNVAVSDPRFEVVNERLWLKAGQVIDYETEKTIEFVLSTGPDGSVQERVSIEVIDVVEEAGGAGGSGSGSGASDQIGRVVMGTPDSDILTGTAGDDSIYGLQSDDIISGGDGNDFVGGGAGDDKAFGGAGNDTVAGGAGNDVVGGGAGNDQLLGGAGNDTVYGGSGDDTIYAGSGADRIYGGSGNDVIYFGANDGAADVYASVASNGSDTLWGFEDGIDKLNLTASGIASFSDLSGKIADDGAGNVTIDLGGGNVLTLRGVTASQLSAADFEF